MRSSGFDADVADAAERNYDSLFQVAGENAGPMLFDPSETLNCAYIGRELGLPTHPPEAQTSEPDEPGAADKSHAVE